MAYATRWGLRVALLSVIGAFLLCAQPLSVDAQGDPVEFGRVAGTISAQVDRGGDPVRDAEIVFDSMDGEVHVRIQASGHYGVELPPGRYYVHAFAEGYLPYSSGPKVVSEGGASRLNIYMTPVDNR